MKRFKVKSGILLKLSLYQVDSKTVIQSYFMDIHLKIVYLKNINKNNTKYTFKLFPTS